MPLVLDPAHYDRATLESLAAEMATELAETREMAVQPRGAVRDPASLELARELVDATLAALGRPAPRTATELAVDVNLGYAVMLATIDLVKSHTVVPRVPGPRKKGPP
ncbi:MAG: hypothetical protein ACRECT_08575 [Thermoplasmata archaeon]